MRTFIAVGISDEVRQRIAELQKELPSKEALKVVDPGIIHITLKFLGEIDESKVPEIKKIISSISFEPFTVTTKGVGVFPNENFIRVIWIGAPSPELDAMAKELNEKLKTLGFKSEEFTSHVTIARVKTKIDLTRFLADHREEKFGSFAVDGLRLMKSTLTPKGPIYEEV
jgi:2'-5' RNA ligase